MDLLFLMYSCSHCVFIVDAWSGLRRSCRLVSNGQTVERLVQCKRRYTTVDTLLNSCVTLWAGGTVSEWAECNISLNIESVIPEPSLFWQSIAVVLTTIITTMYYTEPKPAGCSSPTKLIIWVYTVYSTEWVECSVYGDGCDDGLRVERLCDSTSHLTLSPPIPLRLYTLPCWSNPLFLFFDIRTLWHSVLSTRAPECQELKMAG